jgi:uncharacterized membrane protein YfcA
MGRESLVGAGAGGAFAGSTTAELLKLLLGLILVAAALKAFCDMPQDQNKAALLKPGR